MGQVGKGWREYLPEKKTPMMGGRKGACCQPFIFIFLHSPFHFHLSLGSNKRPPDRVDHKYMKPKSIHHRRYIVDNFSNDYLCFACVAFIKKVKKGLSAEHSRMLDDTSETGKVT